MTASRTRGLIREVETGDAGQISDIYNHYVERSNATFEERPVPATDMERRIMEHAGSLPWLVWVEDGRILGYCYASKWRDRSAYRHSVEVTIYVRDGHTGAGIGGKLYAELLGRLRNAGVRAAVAVIALPNESSVALHESFGFEKAGHLREIGRKFDRWIDVGFWETVLSP